MITVNVCFSIAQVWICGGIAAMQKLIGVLTNKLQRIMETNREECRCRKKCEPDLNLLTSMFPLCLERL